MADKAPEEELRQLKQALEYLMDIYRMESNTERSRGHLIEARWLAHDAQMLYGVMKHVGDAAPDISNSELFALVHKVRLYVMTQEG